MSEWIQEWWGANGRPIVEAILSSDMQAIQTAVMNAPSAYLTYIRNIFERSPEHVIIETFLILFVLYITFVKKSYNPASRQETKLTESEIDELCNEWTPESLVPENPDHRPEDILPQGVLEDIPDSHMKIQGIKDRVLNFGTFDFLGIASRQEVRDVVDKTLRKYGCGSCGPRGFYGTIDTHTQLEKDLAKYMGTDDAILYSDAEATVSSVIPAFAKRGDLLVIDNFSNDSIHVGAALARSRLLFYKHNDMDDLERVLMEVKTADKKAGRSSECQRRYVVAEGIFRNSGEILDLPKVLKLCKEHCFRLLIDESYSFGVLGKTGRGITEYFGIDISEIDVICGSLSTSIASVGGFSTGSQVVVDNQRITSAGYVFSAAAPPFTSTASSTALSIMDKEPALFETLSTNSRLLHAKLKEIDGFIVKSSEDSPLHHIKLDVARVGLENADEADLAKLQQDIMNTIARECLQSGVGIAASKYKPNQVHKPEPTLRVTVSSLHTSAHIEEAGNIIARIAGETLAKYHLTPVNSHSPEEALVSPRRSARRRKKVNYS